jgi:CRISPR type IV-associated protein Csf3
VRTLRIEAEIQGPIALGGVGYVHLDGLLAYAVVLRDQIEPASVPEEILPVEIPVEREPGGRFHLASASVAAVERTAARHVVRRFPIEHEQAMGRAKSVSVRSGTHRDYRFPLDTVYVQGDRLVWWALGDEGEVRALLSLIHYVGRKRSVGLGRVGRWSVVPAEEMWDGFPVLGQDGAALRHLPPDWPGLGAHSRRYGRLTYPYHHLGGKMVEIAAPCR